MIQRKIGIDHNTFLSSIRLWIYSFIRLRRSSRWSLMQSRPSQSIPPASATMLIGSVFANGWNRKSSSVNSKLAEIFEEIDLEQDEENEIDSDVS
uniref:Uncharacterized protein n=1 Tax=Ditylenchus dipsaci TaxID=166011 RepID=A0A915D3V0_9BILA